MNNTIQIPVDVLTIIVRKMPEKDYFVIARVSKNFLKAVNRCWASLTLSYGFSTERIINPTKRLTATQSVFDALRACSKTPWFLDAYRLMRGDFSMELKRPFKFRCCDNRYFVSMRPFYDSQAPYDGMNLRKPRSVGELFKLFAIAQNIKSQAPIPMKLWMIIIRKLSEKDLLAVSRVSKYFLEAVNLCCFSQAKTYGIRDFYFTNALTIAQSVYNVFLDMFEIYQRKAQQTGYETSIYSSKPKSIDELFKIFAKAKDTQGGVLYPFRGNYI